MVTMQYNELFKNIYAGKKVFLTGHTGFKGAWMLLWLHQLGAIVKGYALDPEYKDQLYPLIKGDSLCESVIADIRDKETLEEALLSFQPDFVFHLAAQPLVRYSYQQPVYTFEVNVNGTLNVLEAVRQLDKSCSVVLITTDKVYENIESDYYYIETDKLGGYDPYSASKAASEIVISSYRNSFFNPADFDTHRKAVASARAGNVIGGGDWSADRIIPDIVRALHAQKPVTVRNPAAVRPWQHVLEPVGGYLLLGSKLAVQPQQFASAWNFGPQSQDTLTVKEVVEKALSIWGAGTYETPQQVGQPHEAGLLQLSIDKSTKQLGWVPRWSAGEAIAKTIEWYKSFFAGNAVEKTFEQINSYGN
jgi:CDP-glucose 4,6-dehydratase